MNAADRNLVRLVLPPLLGLGLVAALTHPLDRAALLSPVPNPPTGSAAPQHTDRITP